MNLPPIFAVLETLPRFKQTRETQWTACCPAHDDTEASLSIGIGDDGRILVKCFTGCDPEDIRAALQGSWADYFPGGSFPGEKRYEVRDRNGVVRGVQRRVYLSTGKKQCPWLEQGTKAQEMPLYGSEQVKQLAAGAQVILCEGPYVAAALIARGIPAFGTMTGAGGQPSDDALRVLRRFRVVIWPDNDEPGRKHLRKIAARLDEMNVTVIGMIHDETAPPHGDAVDYFAHGGTVEELGKLVMGLDARPLPKGQTAIELMAKNLKPPKWAVPHLFAEGLNVLAGKPKKGKSAMMLQLCLAVAEGGMALGKIECAQGEALYLALEDNEPRMQRRLNGMLPHNANGDAIPPAGLTFYYDWPRLDDGGIEQLSEWMRKHPATRLIVVDTMTRIKIHATSKNMPLYDQDYTGMEPLQKWAISHGIAVVAIVHLRKMGAEDVMDEISGSTGLTAIADNVVVMRVSSNTTVLHRKGRDYDDESPLALASDGETLRWTMQGNLYDATRSAERNALLEALSMMGGWRSPKEIAEFTGKSRPVVRMALRRIVDSGDTALEYDSERHLYRVSPKFTRIPNHPVFSPTPIIPYDDDGYKRYDTGDTHGLNTEVQGDTDDDTREVQGDTRRVSSSVPQSINPVSAKSITHESGNTQGLGASVSLSHSKGVPPSLPLNVEQCPRRDKGNGHNYVRGRKPPYNQRCEFCGKVKEPTHD